LTEFAIGKEYTKDHNAAELWELHDKRDVYRRRYSDYWNAANVDVVLCPFFSGTAAEHDTSRYWSYTAIWNLTDYPSVVFPTGLKVDPAIDKPSTHKPLSKDDEIVQKNCESAQET
jgi:amidase